VYILVVETRLEDEEVDWLALHHAVQAFVYGFYGLQLSIWIFSILFIEF
jgi:hypothetical protein